MTHTHIHTRHCTHQRYTHTDRPDRANTIIHTNPQKDGARPDSATPPPNEKKHTGVPQQRRKQTERNPRTRAKLPLTETNKHSNTQTNKKRNGMGRAPFPEATHPSPPSPKQEIGTEWTVGRAHPSAHRTTGKVFQMYMCVTEQSDRQGTRAPQKGVTEPFFSRRSTSTMRRETPEISAPTHSRTDPSKVSHPPHNIASLAPSVHKSPTQTQPGRAHTYS